MLDSDQVVTPRAVVTDRRHSSLALLNVQLGAVAVAPRLSDHQLERPVELDAAQAPQRLDGCVGLQLRLKLVLDVLQLTATASAEVWARRLSPTRARLQQPIDDRSPIVRMPLHQIDLESISRGRRTERESGCPRSAPSPSPP